MLHTERFSKYGPIFIIADVRENKRVAFVSRQNKDCRASTCLLTYISGRVQMQTILCGLFQAGHLEISLQRKEIAKVSAPFLYWSYSACIYLASTCSDVISMALSATVLLTIEETMLNQNSLQDIRAIHHKIIIA